MEFPTPHTESSTLLRQESQSRNDVVRPPQLHPRYKMARAKLARRAAAISLRQPPSAFTLAEALIASVVLAISVVGVAAALASSSRQSMATDEAAITTALGKQLLEEIAAKPFPIAGVTTNPGWSQGNQNRATYDDAADYNGYTDSTPITTLSGITIDPGANYTRGVTFVERINPSDTPGAGDFGLITVTVTGPSGASSIFSRIVANVTAVR
jgi:type II secretory pathway pseudopilin PulG